jgi:nickel/cobalt exporter
MRRVAIVLACVAALIAGAAPAAAHPLGNFSINHLAVVSVDRGQVNVGWTLDQAEIPTFQQRGLSPDEVLARVRAEVTRRLALKVDGRRRALRLAPGGQISFPMGAGGLHTTRVELRLSAPVRLPARIALHDGTYPGHIGWKALVARPGSGSAVRSDVPSGDPTGGLRHYPTSLLSSPLNVRDAALSAHSGSGTLTAPRGLSADHTTADRGQTGGFARLLQRAADGQGVLILLVLAAFGWGALHALSPGHGKTMVAAYLVGTRGTARHAVALGLVTTVTHTAGVFGLGLVTLALSQYILPEDLYPWLNLASGLLVVGVGATVLRSRSRRARHAHHHHHHNDDGHDHGHHHHVPDELSTRSLLAMGASAGLIPCPSALVVLLGAIAQHQIALGLLLIVAFSAGLAATLTVLGLLVVHASRLATRFSPSPQLVALLPAISALVIVGAGCLLTARAVGSLA